MTAGLACAFGIFSITIAVDFRLISHLKTHTTHTTRLQIKLHDAQIFRFDSNFNTTESNNKSKSFLFRFGKIIYIGWSNFFSPFLQCVIPLHTFAFHETLVLGFFRGCCVWMDQTKCRCPSYEHLKVFFYEVCACVFFSDFWPRCYWKDDLVAFGVRKFCFYLGDEHGVALFDVCPIVPSFRFMHIMGICQNMYSHFIKKGYCWSRKFC